ncbi:MAG TPA: DUF427 domain-containing protein [Acidimicrobiales bacterium]|nr:DUF427 domain-containing protein [Acidimicrobiales bacterium]
MTARPQPIPPGPGQESVWGYPRPPRVEPCRSQVEVVFAGVTIAVTLASYRVLETSHPPNYYFPPDSVIPGIFRGSVKTTWCEWKGEARYYSLVHRGKAVADAVWYYPDPLPGYEAIAGYYAFYPALMEACIVDTEVVLPQPGGFYGGWITHELVGPFKGEPGSMGW